MAKKNASIEGLKQRAVGMKHKRMEEILGEMQVKLEEIDTLRKEMQRSQFNAITPQKSKSMLEEIKVPSIEMIREEKKKN
ncbi:MAG TPA: hypothetical protein VFF13_03455 [archaeon]|nr:hypothetical protein [archaeon]